MFKSTDIKAKFSGISAKTLSFGGKQYMRARNEQQVKLLEQYTYTPLSGPRIIRLLQIEHGADTDVVSCRLFETDLDQKPSFDALSYTWNLDPEWNTAKLALVEDEKKEERPILCNGRTRLVSMNLYHALTEFRRQGKQLPLWADQICINQLDGREKAAQLAIMVNIYRSASCVIIWLGKLSALRNSALNFLEKLPNEGVAGQVMLAPEDAASHSIRARLQDSLSIMTGEVSDHYHWLTVLFILGRKWFSRAWTLQEMLLATNFQIVMGSREIAPETIQRAITAAMEFYQTDEWSVRGNISNLVASRRGAFQARLTLFKEREEFQHGKRYSAEEYLNVIRHREATVKKDKVVAGAALMKDNASVTLDYDSTTLEFYAAYAERLWPEVGIFALSLVGGIVCTTEGLPSWMPDLSNVLLPVPLRYCDCPTFAAPPFGSHGAGFSIDGKVLRLDVAQWDVVVGVGESIWSWTRYDDPLDDNKRLIMATTPSVPAERFGLMFPLLNKLGPTYAPTGERTIDSFWQTLIGGINTKTDDDLTVWRDRFFQWFAYTLTSMRGSFREESNRIKKAWLPTTHFDKSWWVPLIADWPQMEQRVSQFLETHDILVDSGELHASSLRQAIAGAMKRILGTENINEVNFDKGSLAEFLDLARKDHFYTPISLFTRYFESIYQGRRIVTTEKGYIGATVESVRTGDVVCLVSGADVPYVFRPVPGKERTFTLVGEAYVHGIMHGGADIAAGLVFDPVSVI